MFSVARGPRYVVSEVTFDGLQSLTSSAVEQLLRVEAGDPFVQADLDAALGRLAEAYRRVGFVGASVKVDVASPPPVAGAPGRAEIPVALRVAVTEGVQTVVGDVTFVGNEAVPSETLSSGLSLRTGEPYYPPRLTTDLDAVVLQYLNRGFQTASADAKVEFSRGQDPREHPLRDRRRPSGVHRPYPGGRQQPDPRRDHSTRAGRESGPAPQLQRHHREPAPPERPRPVSARADHRAPAPELRNQARSARDGRGGPAHDSGLRLGRRRRPPPPPDRGG